MDDPRSATEALARVLARVWRPAVVMSAPPPFAVVEAPLSAAPPAPSPRTPPAAAGPPVPAPLHPDPSRPAVLALPRREGRSPAPDGPSSPPEVDPPSNGAAATVPAKDPPEGPPGRDPRHASSLPQADLPEVEVILDPAFPSPRDQPARPSAVSGPQPALVTPGTSPDGFVDVPPTRPRVADASGSPQPPTHDRPTGTPSRDAPARDAAPPSIVIERIDIASPPPTGAAADPLASLAGRRRGRSRQPTPPAR